ncbi:MAG: MBL fold metallo-hydrolase [Planctomycetes bacterium]|nr:MBL fold metallo-hydrolase [Planctomycetota bacterium]
MSTALNIRTLLNSWFGENTYVVWRPGGREALVIDPGIDLGLDLEPLTELLRDEGLTVAAILNTHGHGDHIGGNQAIKRAYPAAPLVIGENEKHLLTDSNANLSAPFGFPIVSPPADRTVREGDVLEYAGIRLEVLDIPGHSPGHVVFVHPSEPTLVFGGDVLFRGGIGRYDFPGSDGELLFHGIREKLFALPDDTVVYPGHGPVTTIGYEARTNPYVGEGDI